MHRTFVRCATVGLAATLAALALTGCSESEAPDCGALTVKEPWVRVAPAGAEVMGAYFTLSNTGDAKVVVNGVTSSQFDRAEMHETVVNDNGQASMQPLEKVTVPAGESIDFKPGGRHVMLFNPTQPYAAGDQVELILACGSQNAELPVAATVRAEQPGAQNEGDTARGMDHAMDHDMAPADHADEGAAADDAATAS
ncbi:copper chaperone PCu(A)C [Salinisphaera sp. T31B1]|uniref:copper chaperone PCu(A)C n=1 Tax=Salinisphaera sp. T31B1 TaxID=727963 RepID=UPI003340646B